MNLNIFRPEQAVMDAIERPNFVLALILVLLPSLAAIIGRMDFGEKFLVGSIYSIVLSFIAFFLLTLTVFVLCKLVGGKAGKRFAGLFSALSLIKIVSLIVVVLSLIATPLILSPQAMEFLEERAEARNSGAMALQAGQFFEENPDAVNLPVFGAFAFITLLLLIFALYLVYTAIKVFTGTKWVTALVLTIVTFVIQGTLLAIINGAPVL
jgi:hypothetical protein